MTENQLQDLLDQISGIEDLVQLNQIQDHLSQVIANIVGEEDEEDEDEDDDDV